MKRILLLLTLFLLCNQCVFCANINPERRNARLNLEQSNLEHQDTCIRVIENFRYDHKFGNYMKARCQLFMADRQQLLDTVFTITSTSSRKNDIENSDIPKSAFAINLNKKEINAYKSIVEEYCKYNSYKFAQKNPQACSPQKIKSLFQTIP